MTASARKIWAILRREYLTRVRNKWFLVITLGFPVLILGLSAIPPLLVASGEGGGRPLRVGVLDRVGGERIRLARRLETEVDELTARPVPPETVGWEGGSAPRRRELAASLRESDLDAYLAVETVRDSSRVTLYSLRSVALSRRSSLERAARRSLLERRLRDAGLEVPDARSIVGTSEVSLDVIRLDEEGTARSQQILSTVAMALNFVLYMMFLVYGQMIMRGVLEEKRSDIVEVLVSSVRPWELMAGKIVGIGAVGITQLLVWAAAGLLLTLYGLTGAAKALAEAGIDLRAISLPWLEVVAGFVVFFLLGYLLYASVFAGLGALAGDDQSAQYMNFPAVLLIGVAFILAFPAMQAPGAGWVVPVSLVPFFSPILMVLRITLGVATAWEVVAALVVLAATVAGLAWLAGRIYRVGILMKGKPPNLPELARWIRYG